MKRRAFLGGLGAAGAISMLDWLSFFKTNGVPGTPRELGIAKAHAGDAGEPRFLIYWFLEGGWDGYSMFNPVATANDALSGKSSQDAIYRPAGIALQNGLYPVADQGGIKYGHIATPGTSLFNDMAIVSSHHGGKFHSGSRLQYHLGTYNYALGGKRGVDERSVMQAFAEAYGSSYLLPHISWHSWLSDGELSPANFPEGTGYYEKLGPAYAQTIYGGTPDLMRQRIAQIKASGGKGRDAEIHKFVDNLHQNFIKDKNSETVKAFSSAVELHRTLASGGSTIEPAKLFTDAALLAEFKVAAGKDDQTSSTSVNGNPARSKNSPNTNVQALMAYELMTKHVSTCFWIESRNIRGFDSHRNRQFVLQNKGQYDQAKQMETELWAPLQALVKRLKNTEYSKGRSYWDLTTIVLASEMGRSVSGGDDDVCQHWDTSSVAFLGGSVKGGTQWGGVGTQTLDSIPIMADTGKPDPSFDPVTGALKPGQTQAKNSYVSNAGHVYATALELAGIPKSAQKGKNEAPPMSFLKK